jgi:hypothetical protein
MLISEIREVLVKNNPLHNVLVDTIESMYSIVSYTYLNKEDELVLECGKLDKSITVKDLITELENYNDSTVVKVCINGKDSEVEGTYSLIDDTVVFLFAFQEE